MVTTRAASSTARFDQDELLREVDARTSRQVRDLSVSCRGMVVVLRGLSKSYYMKQLATHAVFEVAPGVQVENGISVSRG